MVSPSCSTAHRRGPSGQEASGAASTGHATSLRLANPSYALGILPQHADRSWKSLAL